MASDRRIVSSLVLAGLLLLAGCGASGGDALSGQEVAAGGGGGDAGAVATATPMAEATPAATDAEVPEDAGSAGGPVPGGRALVKTGRVTLEVDSFEETERNLTRLVERYGGFVSDSHRRLHRVDNATFTTGALVLRVPSENFSALLSAIRREGLVLEMDTDTRDVTDRLVDIQARLENLRAERDRLRELYRRANDTEDVLAVERRLSDVQGRIERLEARRKSLRRRVALSTVRVEIREPRPEPESPERVAWYETSVLGAFLESIGGAVTAVRALVVLAAYALPYLLVFGVPLAALAGGAWYWRRVAPVRREEAEKEDE